MKAVEGGGLRDEGGVGRERGSREGEQERAVRNQVERQRQWRKSVVVSHVRSSDGDVLGIATRAESERRRTQLTPLGGVPPPESHPPSILPAHSALPRKPSVEAAATTVAPPQHPPRPPQPHCEDQTHAPYLSSRCISVQHLPGELVALLHYARDVQLAPIRAAAPVRTREPRSCFTSFFSLFFPPPFFVYLSRAFTIIKVPDSEGNLTRS